MFHELLERFFNKAFYTVLPRLIKSLTIFASKHTNLTSTYLYGLQDDRPICFTSKIDSNVTNIYSYVRS